MLWIGCGVWRGLSGVVRFLLDFGRFAGRELPSRTTRRLQINPTWVLYVQLRRREEGDNRLHVTAVSQRPYLGPPSLGV
jgi:hypothetical protein